MTVLLNIADKLSPYNDTLYNKTDFCNHNQNRILGKIRISVMTD